MKFRHSLLILMLVSFAIIAIAQDGEKTGEKAGEKTKGEYKPRELSPSWKDLGMMYYAKQDWVNSIYYLKRWVEADPRDTSSWYNLACSYGLAGNAEDALDAFETSVDSGWSDGLHAMSDEDLKIIWEHERFKAAVERCKLNVAKVDGPEGYIRRYIELKRMGTYIAMLPPDYEKSEKKYPLVVILHGWGSTELGHGRLSDKWGRDDVIYIAPRYPYAATSIFLGAKKAGYSAYYDGEEVEEKYWAGMMEQAVNWVFACVDDAKKQYRVKGEKVFIFGHSQGAGLANTCGFMRPERIEAYVAYAGWLDEKFQTEEYYKKVIENKVKVFLLHGNEDNRVKPEASIIPTKLLKDAGVDCTLKLVASNHSFSPDVNDYMIYWINKYVRGMDVKDEVPDAEFPVKPKEETKEKTD
ncbi:MAG: dienelactone hydrolase family protein [Planctomycetes bacterium]|nr:dienelactone hydrolase family protein [Planctomycetota bacterium]